MVSKKYLLSQLPFQYVGQPQLFNFMVKKIRTEAVVQRCSVKKMFLEISQNSQENTCAGDSFLVKLQACNFIKKETLAQVFSCEFCEISKNTFFHRTPLVAVSAFLNSHVSQRFLAKSSSMRPNITKYSHISTTRSSHPEVFYKKRVLKNFAKNFTGQYLCL